MTKYHHTIGERVRGVIRRRFCRDFRARAGLAASLRIRNRQALVTIGRVLTIKTEQVSIYVTSLIAAVGLILFVLGIGRIRLRWLAGGAALLAIAALQGAMTEDEPWQSVEIVTLRIRVADAAGRPVVPTRVQIGRPGGRRNSVSTIGPDGVALVSAVVEAGGGGSVGRQLERAHPQVDLGAYQLEVLADGYRPWRMPLARLLPRDWPLITPQGTTDIRLEPAP